MFSISVWPQTSLDSIETNKVIHALIENERLKLENKLKDSIIIKLESTNKDQRIIIENQDTIISRNEKVYSKNIETLQNTIKKERKQKKQIAGAAVVLIIVALLL
jgi:hypothetical protein